jgi:hypothetical protein
VHELNARRGALGEPDAVEYAELSPRVVNLSLVFGGVDCQLARVDLPGRARYSQELAFFGLDRRLVLTLPSPYLRGRRQPRTSGIDGLHDVALCHAIARVHMSGEPVPTRASSKARSRHDRRRDDDRQRAVQLRGVRDHGRGGSERAAAADAAG